MALSDSYWFEGTVDEHHHQNHNSPGVKGGAVKQSAVEMVTHKVGAHHGAHAVFGGGDGFGDDQVSFVPQIQQMDVKHDCGVRRNNIT